MSSRSWRVVMLVVGGWFAIQVISGGLFSVGGVVADVAIMLRPLDGEARLEAALMHLSLPREEWTGTQMQSVLKRLDASVQRNPLNFHTHLNRARVLLRLEEMGEDTSDVAATAMHRTLFLRWKDPEIGLAGMRFALSRWPLLDEGEQAFYRGLFARLVTVIRGDDFNRILEIWARYSLDMEFLETGLSKRPDFCRNAAEILASRQIHLDDRLRFLARYEVWALDSSTELLQRRLREDRDNYDTWKHIAHHLPQGVRGYFRLVPESGFNYSEYIRLMDNLQMRMVTALAGTMNWSRNLSTRKEIMKLATAMVERPAAEATLKELYQRLERTRFFVEFKTDLAVLELRLRLLLQAGEANAAALVGGEVSRERHYVPADDADAVRRIFLLYAESLERLGRGDEARRVIDIAGERTGSHVSLDWMRFCLKSMDEVDPDSPSWQALSPQIRDSYRILLEKKRIVRTVYPPPQRELLIKAGENAVALLDSANLVQVWGDGKILAERYAKDLEAGEEWRIKLFEEMGKHPVKVEIIVK